MCVFVFVFVCLHAYMCMCMSGGKREYVHCSSHMSRTNTESIMVLLLLSLLSWTVPVGDKGAATGS